MTKVVHCECGYVARGQTDEELVADMQRHVTEDHPGTEMTREQVIAMATEE